MEGTDGPNTFSSALMRQRDQIVEDKHRKEKDTLNARVHKLKMANEDTLKEFFDLSNRCGRMVRMLGFKDISEAEAAIEAADGVQLFKEFLERGDQLEDDLASERAKSDKLFEEAATLKQEKEKLKADVASAERKLERTQSDAARQQAKAERLTTELNQLKSRYDTLSDVRERCAVKYKKDYATWRNMKDWIFDDSGLDGLDLTEKARKSKMNALVKEKKQIIKDHHARGDEASEPAPHPPLGDVDFVEEEEEIQSTTPRERKHSTSQPSSPSPQDEEPPSPQAMKQEANPSARKSLFKPGTNELLSSSPSPFNDYPPRKSSSTRTPLTFEPIGKLMPKQWSPNQRDLSTTHPPTSQTEPESPERNPHAMENHAPTSPASSPPHIASSQTEPESQSQYFAFPPPTFPPKSTPRPLTTMNMVPRTVPARIGGGAVVSRDPETMQPIKMLKLGDHPATSPRRKPPHRIPAMFANSSTPSQSRKPLGSKENRPFLAPTSTPMNSKENVPKPGDYSAFKGRGRYAKEATVGKGTINAQFMIDPERNGGVNHQFNEVVRNKRERQQMDAGDCDCCRGYYEAVGPLPARMQAPLWRSPEKNKKMTHSPSCKHHGKASGLEDDNDDMQDEIGEHHKAVSRHRHHWARANTPPGYWEIGFPNTQEAEDINEKAREMHEKKRQEVDAAARREGGRLIDFGHRSLPAFEQVAEQLTDCRSASVRIRLELDRYQQGVTTSLPLTSMAKVVRANSKKGVRSRAKLSKPRPPAGTSAGQDGAEPKGIRRAFFKLEELGRKLRSQKENLVIDWEIDVPEEKQEGEKVEGEGEKEAGEMEKLEENVLQPLANTVSTQLTTITPADTLQPIAPPPTPTAQRIVHSSPGNIFVNGGHSHRLSSTRQCPSSPPRPGTRIALQNSDSNLDEDLVILSTLENSAEQPLPFCCHEELLEMAPPQLVEVAKKLNACLPAALAIRTELGYGYGPEELTRNIERVVGIRTEPVETPMHVHAAQAAITSAASSGPEIPFHRLSEVVSSVFKEEFDDASESDFPSPPTSPLARTKYARFSIFNPGTKLTPLREEETMKAAETLLSLPHSQRAVGPGASPLLPNPWEDADPAVFADVSTMADANMTDEEEDEETNSEPDTDVKSRPGPRIPATPSSSSLSSMESLPTPKPASKVRRTQSMRVPYAPKADSATSQSRVLRSQSQRVPDTGASGMASKAKTRRTSVGALANRDTSFITTKRPSYRFKAALEAKEAVASGSRLKRSLSERQRSTGAGKDQGLGRRSTIAGAQIQDSTSTKASVRKHTRAKSLIPVASTKRKRKGEKVESDDEDMEDED